MKNKKAVRDFYFLGMTKQELKDILNNEYPIDIKKMEIIIQRIHEKYPLIDKSQISLIVRSVFQSIRDFLILGYIINFNKFIFDMKLNFFTHVINGKINSALRVKLKTPPKLRK